MADSLPTLRNVKLKIRPMRLVGVCLRYRLALMVGLLFILLGGCKQEPTSVPGLERISVDLSQARTGKLSEFFEPHIDYIWLEDNSEEAQLNAGLQKVLFHEDRIYTLDIYGCKCIHIFDKSGKYLSKIDAYGEGPGKYVTFDDAAFIDEELVLLGVHPSKIMWFSLDGDYLREVSFDERMGPGVFSEFDDRYYFYTPTRDPDRHIVKSLDKQLQDTINYFPYDPEKLYGHNSGRNNLQKSAENLYFGMIFSDTIYQVESENFVPKLVFDFGKYAQDPEELKKLDNPVDRVNFLNNSAKLYFRGRYLISEKQLFSILVYDKKGFYVFYDRGKQQTHLVENRILDDIDGGYDPHIVAIHSLELGKVGLTVPGRDLYEVLMEKKANMGKAEFENWVKDQGRNFAETAIKARASENPVLIVYRLK